VNNMKKLFLLAIFLAIPYFAHADTYIIQINWPYTTQQELVDQRDYAAIALHYEENITYRDPETGEISLIPNPVSKAQAIRNALSDYLKLLIRVGYKKSAHETADATIETDAESLATGITAE